MSETGTIAFTVSTGETVRKNPWRVVGMVAERLGVQPIDGREVSGAMIVCGAEYVPIFGGHVPPTYDINEVVTAFLDRLDEIERGRK